MTDHLAANNNYHYNHHAETQHHTRPSTSTTSTLQGPKLTSPINSHSEFSSGSSFRSMPKTAAFFHTAKTKSTTETHSRPLHSILSQIPIRPSTRIQLRSGTISLRCGELLIQATKHGAFRRTTVGCSPAILNTTSTERSSRRSLSITR